MRELFDYTCKVRTRLKATLIALSVSRILSYSRLKRMTSTSTIHVQHYSTRLHAIDAYCSDVDAKAWKRGIALLFHFQEVIF